MKKYLLILNTALTCSLAAMERPFLEGKQEINDGKLEILTSDNKLIVFTHEQVAQLVTLKELSTDSASSERLPQLEVSKERVEQVCKYEAAVRELIREYGDQQNEKDVQLWKKAYEGFARTLPSDLPVLAYLQGDVAYLGGNPVLDFMVKMHYKEMHNSEPTTIERLKKIFVKQDLTKLPSPATDEMLAASMHQAFVEYGIVLPFGYCNLLLWGGKKPLIKKLLWRTGGKYFKEYYLGEINTITLKDEQQVADYGLESVHLLGALEEAWDLSNCNLSNFPINIVCFTHLKALDLEHNQLKKIPPEVGQLKNLELLWLNSNQLLSLPEEIGMLSRLVSLNLSFNKLSHLPASLQSLPLKALFIMGNRLCSLPEWLGKLAELQILGIGENKIKDISPLLSLKNLKVLTIHANQIEALPPEISDLAELEELAVYDNPLKSIPIELLKLKNLTWFEVEKGRNFVNPPQD